MSTSVSVVIPAYNSADYLPCSIGSILSQDYENVEIVVVDDGSTDNTADVVKEFGGRVRYVYQENAKASTARNMGILSSTGDYLMFLDADDTLLPSAIRKLATTLDDSPDYGAAYCGWIETDGPDSVVLRTSLERPSGNVLPEMCSEWMCIVHSIMVRRSCIASTGLYDPALTMFEDMDFNTRIAAHYKVLFVPEHLVEYRLWRRGASQEKKNLDRQRELYMEKMTRWRKMGLLTKRQWIGARRKVYPPTRAETLQYQAHQAYKAGEWLKAETASLQAALANPSYLLGKAWWSVAVKSAVNLVLRAKPS